MTRTIHIRSHERMTWKRCQLQWYWHWRKGYTPNEKSYGALELGTWFHQALGTWYLHRNNEKPPKLDALVAFIAKMELGAARAAGTPDYVLEQADKLAVLAESMAAGYEQHYGSDPAVAKVLAVEYPIMFRMRDCNGTPVFHGLTPDLVYLDVHGRNMLMEHKTAKSIRTEHLAIDDQARPYGVLAEPALQAAGIIEGPIFGIQYNYIRKAIPDSRLTDAQGRYLNKNGTVSRRQPSPVYVRPAPLRITNRMKVQVLGRLERECGTIAEATLLARTGSATADTWNKTPHHSCPRFCDYFEVCALHEQGGNYQELLHNRFSVTDPYAYATADEPKTFEIG